MAINFYIVNTVVTSKLDDFFMEHIQISEVFDVQYSEQHSVSIHYYIR